MSVPSVLSIGRVEAVNVRKGLCEERRPINVLCRAAVSVAAIALLSVLTLAGCADSGEVEEVDLTPNVASIWEEEDEVIAGATLLALPENTITIPYDPEIAPQMGTGYFSMREDFVLTCFTGPTKTVAGVITNFHFEMADSMQEMLTSMGLRASASGGFGLFKVHAAFKFAKELNINAHTVIAVSRYEVQGRTERFERNPELKLPSGRPPEEAYGLCGDYYVHSIQAGGNLYAVITIQTSSREEKSKVETELKASFGSFGSVDASYNSAFAQKLSEYKAKIDAVAVGCKPIAAITNWQEYLGVLKTFKDDVTSCMPDPQASPVTVTLRKADLLYKAAGINPPRLDDQKDALNRLVTFSIEYDQLANDLEHFRLNVGTYDFVAMYGTRENALAKTLVAKDKVAALEQKVERRMDICLSEPYGCRFFTDAELAEADHPDNLRHAVIPPVSFFAQSCDALLVNGNGNMRDGEYTLYFRGQADRPFQAYCRNMDPSLTADHPKTYLSLQGDNYARFVGIWQWLSFMEQVKRRVKGHLYWPDLRTNYSRVLIDVESDAVYIDVRDSTYASNPVEAVKAYPAFCEPNRESHPGFTKVPFGIGARSNSGGKMPSQEPPDPVSMIDLRGTKFRVAGDEHWLKREYSSGLVETYSTERIGANRQTVSLQVMGNVGVTCPSSYPYIKLEYCPECN